MSAYFNVNIDNMRSKVLVNKATWGIALVVLGCLALKYRTSRDIQNIKVTNTTSSEQMNSAKKPGKTEIKKTSPPFNSRLLFKKLRSNIETASLTNEMKDILDKRRIKMIETLKARNFSTEAASYLIPKLGGSPKRLIILASWRYACIIIT